MVRAIDGQSFFIMANLSKVIYINEEDYSTLLNGGTITKSGVTYSHDPTALYVIKNVSAPEYAETAGYATTAGQATKATQDGGGDVISETYVKKADAVEAIHLTGTLSGGYWSFEDINGNTLTDAEMIALLEDPNKLISIYYDGFSDGTHTYDTTVFRPIGSDSTTFTNFDGNWKRYFYISLDWENDRVLDNEHFVGDSLESRQEEIITLGGTNNAPTFSGWGDDTLTHLEFKTQYLDNSKKDVILKVQTSTDVYHYYQLFKSEKQSSTLTNYRFISFPNISTVECIELLYNSSNNTFQRGGNNISLQTLINSSNKLSADYIQDGTNNKVFSAADKTKLDGIEAATASPLMDGNVDVGNSTKYAKEDHVHPSDTSKMSTSHPANAITSAKIQEWDGKIEGAVIGNLSPIEDQNTGDLIGYSCDKTLSELINAYRSGRQVLLYEYDYFSRFLYLRDITDEDNIEDCCLYFYSLPTPDGEILRVSILRENNTDKIYYSAQYITDGYVHETRKINNKPLSTDIILTASDVGADVFVVNIDATFSGGTATYTSNKTFTEVYNAISAKKHVIAVLDDITYYTLTYCEDDATINFYDGSDSSIISIESDNSVSYYELNYQPALVSGTNIKTVNNQSLLGSGNLTPSQLGIPDALKSGSVAGKLYRNNVGGSGNFSISGNSGCIPNLTAGTFLVSIYAKSETQSYTFRFNFGSSVTYDLSTTNSEINDTREITIPSNGTFSGSVLNGSVASGTILYVVMYNYLTPVSTVGIAAVTNRYSDLDGTPTITPVNNGTLTIQQNGITVGTFTANQSSNTTANIYSTMFGTLGQNGFERDNYNSSTGTWAGVEVVTPNPLVTYVDILSNKLYRYNPLTSGYVELSEGDLSTITSTAITDLTDIL